MTKILIVGGYGAVGSDLCRILSADCDIDLVVAGRNGEKASRLAAELGAESRVVDVNHRDSAADCLEGIDVVVNCFVDAVRPSFCLPEAASANDSKSLTDGGLTHIIAYTPLLHSPVLSVNPRNQPIAHTPSIISITRQLFL